MEIDPEQVIKDWWSLKQDGYAMMLIARDFYREEVGTIASDIEIVRWIEDHYSGGVEGFTRPESTPLLPPKKET